MRFQVGLPFPTSALNAFKADFAQGLSNRRSRRSRSSSRASSGVCRGDPGRGSRDPVGRLLRGARHRGRRRVDLDDAWERFTGPVARLTQQIPEDVARGLSPLLRHVPGVADVRGARHGADRPDGEPRGRGLGPAGRLAAPGGPAVPAQRGRALLRARWPTSSRRRPRVPRDRAPDRRHPGPSRGGIARAAKYLDDFGVAMYCGFGRQPGHDGLETMEEHRQTVLSVR